ncbi:MAG: NUDIX hydrolase [Anaerolineales bacterium]|nr:NUDIX hydrolase [Anaerolineales bacterium]
MRPWKTLSRKIILDHSKFLKVESHEVQLPDGQIIPDWTWVTIPSAAIVLARREDGQFLCFRQTKYAVEGTSLATVGGMLEKNEEPLDAAKRELLEEIGYQSSNWVDLGSYILDPNRGVATMYLFLALDAKFISPPNSDDLEDQEIILLNQDGLEQALKAGEFKILAWTTVVALSLGYLAE